MVTGANRQVFYEPVTIPSVYQGLPVKELAPNAFHVTHFYGGLTLPDSLSYIGEHCFDTSSVEGNLVIPASVETLEPYTFRYFEGNIVLRNGLRVIKDRVFDGMKGSLTLPASITDINDCMSNASINKLTILGDLPLERNFGYSTVQEIICSGTKDLYVSGNCLIRKSTGTLIKAGVSFSLPASGLRKIGNLAIYTGFDEGTGSLYSLSLPEGITELEDFAVYSYSLLELDLPRSLTSLENGMIVAEHIRYIYYGGTLSQWQELIGKGPGIWSPGARAICSDGSAVLTDIDYNEPSGVWKAE